MTITGEGLFIHLILIHFLSDFGLQTHEQAIGKGLGNNPFNSALITHVGVYSMIWFIYVFAISLSLEIAILFSMITFMCHWITDYTTSRINKGFFDKGDMHNGFVGVGMDQLLHYVQLYYTFKFLL